jgi:hypothetical protein
MLGPNIDFKNQDITYNFFKGREHSFKKFTKRKSFRCGGACLKSQLYRGVS